MNDVLAIQVAQLRNRADALGQAVADLVRDAYAMGRADGLAEHVTGSCGATSAGQPPERRLDGAPMLVPRDPDYIERDDLTTRRPWRI